LNGMVQCGETWRRKNTIKKFFVSGTDKPLKSR
jgi:hypothetical protein